MIVWVNGAFGVGKTTVAGELVSLLPRARVYDPEPLGWLLQRTLGRLQRGVSASPSHFASEVSAKSATTVWLSTGVTRSSVFRRSL